MSPSSCAPDISHSQPAIAAAAPIPSPMNPRRVRRRSCSSALSGAFTGFSGAASLLISMLSLHPGDVIPADPDPKIGPTRADHLSNVSAKENDVAHCEPVMLEPRPFIATREGREPVKLRRLVNRQSRQQTQAAHKDD